MMVEWTINLNVIITTIVVVLGFIGSTVYQAFTVGKFTAAVEARLHSLDKRLESVEVFEDRVGSALVKVAEQQVRLDVMSQRIDDVQKYGSHRLAEVLEAMRGQIMSDFKDRFDFLQRQMRDGK